MSFERRKIRVGRVVSDKMDKTIVVVVEWRRPHRIYKKAVKRQTRFNVHDPANTCKTGDLVRIIETRPISRTKRWRVAEILQREEIAEIQPEEITVEDESVLVAEREAPPDEIDQEGPAAVAATEAIREAQEEVEAEEEAEAEAPEEPVAELEQEEADEEETSDSDEEDEEGREERQR
jgi:small subunit ribosomal protein S17